MVAVSEVMACHVNFDFSVCGQGYFHRKITIVFKFSRCFYSVFVVILVENNERFWPSLESTEHFVVHVGIHDDCLLFDLGFGHFGPLPR